jgi:phospholipid/cholesterol/gamma-HCH transport system permease protein
MKSSFVTRDAVFGLTKATIFGYTITSIASYQGYYVVGGSAGVGKATMSTVVYTCLAVVILDFILASTLL